MRWGKTKEQKELAEQKKLDKFRKQRGNHFCIIPTRVEGQWIWWEFVYRTWYQVYDMGGHDYSLSEPKDNYGFLD